MWFGQFQTSTLTTSQMWVDLNKNSTMLKKVTTYLKVLLNFYDDVNVFFDENISGLYKFVHFSR